MRARAMDMASTASATFLIGTSRLATSATRLACPGRVRHAGSDRRDGRRRRRRPSARAPPDGPQRSRQMFSGEAVGDDRVGKLQIGDIARIGHPRQIDDRRNRQRAYARGGTQRVRVHDVRPLRRLAQCDAMPHGRTTPRRRAASAPAGGPGLACVETGRPGSRTYGDRNTTTSGSSAKRGRREQRPPGHDRDLVAGALQFARPGQVTRLAAAVHHAQAPQQNRHAHGSNSAAGLRSTWRRAHSSRQTSAQMR